MTVFSSAPSVARNPESQVRRKQRPLLAGGKIRRKLGLEIVGVLERKTGGVALDEEVEGIDHRHVGGEIDHDFKLVGALGEYQPRDPVAVRVLLPVQEVGRLDVERIAEDRRPAVGRRPQPDFMRSEIDEPIELVGGSVLERDADCHASAC
jgi:hypothetical protein